MNTYNLEFLHWRLGVSQLKEKEINRIIWVLSQSRHCQDISFSCYGECTFSEEDKETHWHPIVTEGEAFNRKHSNAALFDVHVKEGNDRFDKLFLYHSTGVRLSNWGYVLFNTKTGEQKHKYCITDDLNDLIIHINKELNKIQRHEDGTFNDKSFVGIHKNVYETREGMLDLNDRTRKLYDDLPSPILTKEIYRNNKSFIEL